MSPRVRTARKNFFAKKKNESCGPFGCKPNKSASQQMEETCHAESSTLLVVVGCFVAVCAVSRSQSGGVAQSIAFAGRSGKSEEIVVSATRVPIPEEESPASISVITSEDLEQKQIRRVADSLREVPGLSVVQTGPPGQLTSVFMRGLRSEHTQVLLDGIPINQGLAGLFNFADLTTDDVGRIEVVRGPQSTFYGPRALAGVIQIFTKQGNGTPTGQFSAEAGSFDTFREWASSSGSIGQFDYSVGLSQLNTDNERPNNQYRLSSGVANIGWSPNEQLRISSLFTYSARGHRQPQFDFRSEADR